MAGLTRILCNSYSLGITDCLTPQEAELLHARDHPARVFAPSEHGSSLLFNTDYYRDVSQASNNSDSRCELAQDNRVDARS